MARDYLAAFNRLIKPADAPEVVRPSRRRAKVSA
jgi:hypothetical protein